MATYLLTWNPEKFSTNEDALGTRTLNYKTGEEIRWSCSNKQPKLDDTVYLIRLGVEPKGIVAKGTITKESFSNEDFLDKSKERNYINFKLDSDLRLTCDQGLLSIPLLELTMSDQTWSPQQSGIKIEPQYEDELAKQWKSGEGVHSLTQYFESAAKDEHFRTDWYEDYKETCVLASEIQHGKNITDDDIKKFWYDQKNGVAGVGQGNMYLLDFNNNIEFLREKTKQILENPTRENYQALLAEWKSEGDFKRNLNLVMNRVFAAAAPNKYTSIVYQSYLNNVFKCLKDKFKLDILFNPKDSWLTQNEELTTKTASYFKEEWDVQTRNILLWTLCLDKNNSGIINKNQVKDKDASYHDKEDENTVMTNTSKPKNIIFYGPPGTGKTYHLQLLFKKYITKEQVQPYPLWLAEHLEPLNWMQVLVLCLLDIGGKAKVADIIGHKYYQTKAKMNEREKNLAATAWSYLQTHAISESKTVNYTNRKDPGVFDKTKDSYWYIVDAQRDQIDELVLLQDELKKGPQSKSVITRYSCVTFHQSYGYEEFIEGFKAQTNETGDIHYSVKPGAFLKLCDKAQNDPENRYAIFIDEINRGNISKIFGELITLIETDKRKDTNNEMSVQLSYSGETFSVPSNVDIYGTMNTADRSLAMMDTALRRRFDFKEMTPKAELFDDEFGIIKGINLTRLLNALNQRIEALYDREHTLGHAFLFPAYNAMKAGDETLAMNELQSAFQNKIIPLLEEYFYEDWSKIRLVLGDNQKSENKAAPFVREIPIKYDCLFGKDYQSDEYGQAENSYKLAPFDNSIWSEPSAYQSIYNSPSELTEQVDDVNER